MAADEMGSVSAMPMTTAITMPMMNGACTVAQRIRLPTVSAAAPMGAAISIESPTPTKMVTSGVTRISILVYLLTSLPTSAAAMAISSTASGPPVPPRALAE